ncbi:hypothetical protein D9M70_476660 [compost metagenome]
MPPEAEPVMPASVVTVMASLTSGLGIDLRASATTRKPGRPAITAPNPYSEAVFMEASNEPPTAALDPSANFWLTGLKANTSTARIPTSSAPSTAQIAATLDTSVVTGLAEPASMNSWLLP